jgi:uncharacterized protein (TIGR03435 family)
MLNASFTRIAAGLLAVAGVVFGQAAPPSASLSFEVASIKPAGPIDPVAIMSGKAHVGMSVDKARVDIGGATLMSLICLAYKVKPYQISGQPDWLTAGMNADRYDILAKMPDGADKDKVPEMLQSLLAERFKLTLHRDKRDTPVYALTVAKGGLKMKEVPADPPAPAPAAASPDAPAGSSDQPADSASSKPPAKGEVAFGTGDNRVTMKQSNNGMAITSKETGPMRMTRGENGMMRMEADKMNMDAFTAMLSQFLDRPVVDQTELKGNYQIALDISMDTLMAVARKAGMNPGMGGPPPGGGGGAAGPADAASDPSGGSLFNSVQQLGLKLDARKLPYEFLIIDKVERKPTEN